MRILTFLMVLSIGWLFFNDLANWHYHTSPCGMPVRHAHPYESPPGDNTTPFDSEKSGHEHSGGELYLLAMLSDISMLVLMVAVGLEVFRPLLQVHFIYREPSLVELSRSQLPLLRAPPMMY
ncbi:MAG: hypothetical protein ACQESL_09755 [Bacteroidota bacterium]